MRGSNPPGPGCGGHPLRPDGLRLRRPARAVERLPRRPLGPGPAGQTPDSYYEGPDGIRTAWLESAAQRIPQETLERIPQGGIALEDLTGALKETRFEGAAKAAAWVFAETGNFFLDHTYEDGNYDGFADPWEDEIIAEGTEEWRRASALMDSVCKLSDWLEEDLPGRFAEMLDFVLPLLPEQQQEQEENDHDQ